MGLRTMVVGEYLWWFGWLLLPLSWTISIKAAEETNEISAMGDASYQRLNNMDRDNDNGTKIARFDHNNDKAQREQDDIQKPQQHQQYFHRIAQSNNSSSSSSSSSFSRNHSNSSSSSSNNDPCQAVANQALFLPPVAGSPNVYASSFFENCIASLSIDSINMQGHLNSLFGVFSQYYCFFNVAKDPAASNPKNHEPQLGYTLFGLGGGQVDLAQQLVQIYDQVTTQGATAATFWDIQATFNLLRDAHVTIPALKVPLTSSMLSVVPERTAQYGTTAMVLFSFDANAQLQLELLWSHTNGSESRSRVQTMNGKTVAQFVLDLANSPALGIPFQSVGARVNALMALGAQSLVGSSVTNKYQYRYFLFNLYSSGRPSDILPNSFPVTYMDGTQESFYTVAINPQLDPYVPYATSYQQSSSSMVQINRTRVEAILNEPGDSFLNFRNVIGQINNATSSTSTLNRTRLTQETSWPEIGLAGPRRRLASSSSSSSAQLYAWDKVLNFTNVIDGGMVSAAAYKIGNDYAVLKVESFAIDPVDAHAIWSSGRK